MAEKRNKNSEAHHLRKNFLEKSKPNTNCCLAEGKKPTSLSSLIVWNVSKAMAKNPNMDIKNAIQAAHERLADHDVHTAVSKSSEQRHLTCALLAWQQLGHSDTDSLYQFVQVSDYLQKLTTIPYITYPSSIIMVETDWREILRYKNAKTSSFIEVKIKEQEEEQTEEKERETHSLPSDESPILLGGVCVSNSELLDYSKDVLSASFGSDSVGPVIKLPVETKIVMRADGKICKKCQMCKGKHCSKPAPIKNTVKEKVEAACPKSKSCESRLTCLDKEINLLRNRAAMLAKREKERVELLQRAEQAWTDLESGYQRRLALVDEKEEDLSKQIKNAAVERDASQNSCNALTIELQCIKDNNETQSNALAELDKQLCLLSCEKMKLSEEATKMDAEFAENHCKTSQLDREMQFKEDQARRKLQAIQNELESSETMTNETERAMRAELCALKVQVEQVSKQLLEEDAQNSVVIQEIEDLREEKKGMVEDLESCQNRCDTRMQAQMEELKKKQEQYSKLNERVTECRCKLPVDVVVEAKRTPSLAALCHCSPEDKLLKSCSCTSMRSRLMSSLLSDLFSGLQSEMGGTGQQMPCQMLKCLEDKHNWDRASVVKTNLENYFDKLLIGELDIAIATSIEKYHAKWVGVSCADRVKPPKGKDEDWQQRAIERRAQNLAEGLAEQLFEKRAGQLEQRARDIVTTGPPPCECVPSRDSQNSKRDGKGKNEAAYPVLTSIRLCKLPPHKVAALPPPKKGAEPFIPHMSWRSAMQDVSKLKEQIECLNKESIKKSDLKRMEDNITKKMQTGSLISEVPVDSNDNPVQKDMITKKELKLKKTPHIVEPGYYINLQQSMTQNKSNLKPKTPKPILKQSSENSNSFKQYKKRGQNYAINMCMCSQKRAKKKILTSEVEVEKNDKKSKINLSPSSIKQTKPINPSLSQCKSNRKCNCVCFHKPPSNTSIDQLLETLAKWNKDHSSSENEKEFCSLLYKGCPKEIEKNKQDEDAAEEKKRPSNDINVHKSSIIMKSTRKPWSEKSEGSKSTLNSQLTQPSRDLAGVLPPTEISQLNTEKQEYNESRSFNNDSVIKKTACGSADKNIKPFDNKRDILELPLRDTDVIPPNESKYMGQINLEKSLEEVNKPTMSGKKIKDQSVVQDQLSDDKPVRPEQKRYLFSDKNINSDNVSIGDTNPNADNESIKIQEDSKRRNPSDSYDITFLGVTLTDINSQNQENTNKQCIIGEKKCPATNDKDIIKNGELKSKDPIIMNLETKEEAGDQSDTPTGKETISPDLKVNLNPNNKFTIETKRGKLNIYDKKCTKVIASQQTNKDKGLSIQHIEVDRMQDTPCVCCSYKNMDGSEDLEENTYHLLEEHLKNKLQEFKQTCNDTCIPSEEEEKIFTAILSRVKKVITESTNKITCKCSKQEETSEGSWNRAYGLLQEYLKTKIKRVQCSCVLAEENNDTILPDVLDKVFHLIEYDFKRLQDICGCKMDVDPRNSRVCFKEDVPKNENDLQNSLNTVIYSDVPKNPKNAPTLNKKKENNPIFGCEMFTNNVKNVKAQQNLIPGNDSILNNGEKLFGTHKSIPIANKKIYPKSNLPYASCDCICTNFECSVNGLPDTSRIETVETVFTKPVHDTNVSGKRKPIFNSTSIQVSQSDQVKGLSQNLNKETEALVKVASMADKIAETDLLNDTNAQFNSTDLTVPKCTCCSCTHPTTPLTLKGSPRPYVGYTIDCSCDTALGPCHCAKSVYPDKINNLDNIVKKYLPQEKEYHVYGNKVMEDLALIKNILQTQSLSEMVNGDLFLHKILHNKSSNLKDGETEASICEEDGLILKNSREYFTKTYNKSNTCDDIASLATDSLPHGSCESQICRGVSQSDHQYQLSHSYYNPDDFENSFDAKTGNTASSSEFRVKCSCDMVPICHVKMLVENIENRLVTANCTCDSMIPQVCPKHSMR